MNRRTFLRTLASVGAVLVLPVKWVVERVPDYVQTRIWLPGGPIRIAAANASLEAKAAAHFIASGHNDQAVFDEAFSLMPEGGTIQLSPGVFHLPDGLKGPEAPWTIFGSPDFETIIKGDR